MQLKMKKLHNFNFFLKLSGFELRSLACQRPLNSKAFWRLISMSLRAVKYLKKLSKAFPGLKKEIYEFFNLC